MTSSPKALYSTGSAKTTSDWLTRIHHINQGVLIGLVVIHVGAVVFYLVVKRENLVAPMITG